MYKIFHGFALVEAYQNLKKAKRLAENKSVSRFVKLAIAIVVSLVLWCLPIEIFGVEGLTVIEQRLISIFIFATFMWVFEAVPAWTTSVLIVVLLLLTVSDSSLWFFVQGIPAEELGKAVDLFWRLPLLRVDWMCCWHVLCYGLSVLSRATCY